MPANSFFQLTSLSFFVIFPVSNMKEQKQTDLLSFFENPPKSASFFTALLLFVLIGSGGYLIGSRTNRNQSQVLSKKTAPEEVSKPKTISVPADWTSYTLINPNSGEQTKLSLPPSYSFRLNDYEFIIQNDQDYEETWSYSTSIFYASEGVKNYYTGGAVKDWYLAYLNGKYLFEKPYIFKESKILDSKEELIGMRKYLVLTIKKDETEKHYLFLENNIVHIFKPASLKANTAPSIISKNIGAIFASLNSSQ